MSVHTRVPEPVYNRAAELKKEHDYTSIGEAIRHMCQKGGFDV
jgi:hypothetical protein